MLVAGRPSPPSETTVLTGVKGSLASLGGLAALDTGSAPWSEQLWAMGGRVGSGLRVILNRVLDCTNLAQLRKRLCSLESRCHCPLPDAASLSA